MKIPNIIQIALLSILYMETDCDLHLYFTKVNLHWSSKLMSPVLVLSSAYNLGSTPSTNGFVITLNIWFSITTTTWFINNCYVTTSTQHASCWMHIRTRITPPPYNTTFLIYSQWWDFFFTYMGFYVPIVFKDENLIHQLPLNAIYSYEYWQAP